MWCTGHAPRVTAPSRVYDDFRTATNQLSICAHWSEAVVSPSEEARVVDETRSSGGMPGVVPLTKDNWPGPIAETPSSFPFPTARRVYRREADWSIPLSDVTSWFGSCGVILGPLVFSSMVEEITRTFHAHRDLNASSVADIPATDLYVHVPRLKDGVKPWARSPRKRWSEPQKYWLNRLVQEGIKSGMYESTIACNGQMSDWCAEPVLVPKDESNLWAEQRLTFNYSHVDEEMPGTQLPPPGRSPRQPFRSEDYDLQRF